jgi:hypothetical protein
MTTFDQIVMAADPSIAFAAFEGDETKLLREIIAIMCLDDNCKKLFEAIVAEGFSARHYSNDDDAIERAEKRLRRLRDSINSETNEHAEDVIKRFASLRADEM